MMVKHLLVAFAFGLFSVEAVHASESAAICISGKSTQFVHSADAGWKGSLWFSKQESLYTLAFVDHRTGESAFARKLDSVGFSKVVALIIALKDLKPREQVSLADIEGVMKLYTKPRFVRLNAIQDNMLDCIKKVYS